MDLTFPKVVITILWNLVDFTMIERSDWATCAFPQRIGPVDENPTIALTLSIHCSYH
jgi:hypothetical protein